MDIEVKEIKAVIKKWANPSAKAFIKECEEKFGKYKQVQLASTGKVYKVPIKDILIFGIKGSELSKYPEWKD